MTNMPFIVHTIILQRSYVLELVWLRLLGKDYNINISI